MADFVPDPRARPHLPGRARRRAPARSTLKWFRGGEAVSGSLKKGARVRVTGDVRRYRFGKELIHPEIDLLRGGRGGPRRGRACRTTRRPKASRRAPSGAWWRRRWRSTPIWCRARSPRASPPSAGSRIRRRRCAPSTGRIRAPTRPRCASATPRRTSGSCSRSSTCSSSASRCATPSARSSPASRSRRVARACTAPWPRCRSG